MEQIPLWAGIVGLVVLVIEYVLGKTTWVNPNSILETIFSVLVKIGQAVLPKK